MTGVPVWKYWPQTMISSPLRGRGTPTLAESALGAGRVPLWQPMATAQVRTKSKVTIDRKVVILSLPGLRRHGLKRLFIQQLARAVDDHIPLEGRAGVGFVGL